MVEVLAGVMLTEVEVPFSMVGRSLAEIDLRRRYGVEVVLIHTPHADGDGLEGRPGKLPTPQVSLDPGDRLLVMGARESVEALQRGLARTS